MKNLAIIAALAVSAAAFAAFKPYDQGASVKAAWMTVSSLTTGQEYSLEVAQDGKTMMREESTEKLVTRRGTIPQQLARDFFREINSSEIINSQNTRQSKLVFYRGELLRISAYLNGELTLTEAPLNNFGEAFAHAFGEVKKAAAALPRETALSGFLRAEPLEGEELDAFRSKNAEDGEVRNIETRDIQRVKPLLAAIKEPRRLIPLENETALKELQDFISAHQLSGLRTIFYVPSTRGTFRCQILDAARRAPATEKLK